MEGTRREEVVIASKREVASVVDTTGGTVQGLEENEGIVAQIGVNCKGGLHHIFADSSWHLEGWTTRNQALKEAVILRTRDTPNPWLMACDANMEPDTFVQGKWFTERTMATRVPATDVSPCRLKGPDGVQGFANVRH